MQPKLEHLGLVSRHADHTRDFGLLLGRAANPGDLILLHGPFGAGKTTLVQGIGAGLGIERHVTSPSFTLINEYQGRIPLHHVDLFRLNNLDPEIEQAIEGYEGEAGLTVIEWPDILPEDLKSGALTIDLQVLSDEERSLVVHTTGSRWEADELKQMMIQVLRGEVSR